MRRVTPFFISNAISLFAVVLAGCGDSDDDGPIVYNDAGPCVPVVLPADELDDERLACSFGAGDDVKTTLGIDDATVSAIPITHVIVAMQENRSYDHYFGKLSEQGQPDSEAIPEDFSNPAVDGAPVEPFHLDSTCLEDDPPHQWDEMHRMYADGAMSGFVTTAAVDGSDGRYAMGFYDSSDLPFYYWLASTFSIADRHFGDALAGTWPNRNFLYAGSSYGVRDSLERPITEARTVFDQLDDAGVAWGVYTDERPRQDTLGWDGSHRGVDTFAMFMRQLADGTLPPVTFVDPPLDLAQDEHPPNDIQGGERWTRSIYTTAARSPLWPTLAIIFTYDESGGLFDHVPPPEACLPSPDQAEFDRYGFRVPLIAISPWARPAHVSHVRHSGASILRFIQLLHGLPALSGRDAASDALLDMFDFSCPPPTPLPPEAPPAGQGGCP